MPYRVEYPANAWQPIDPHNTPPGERQTVRRDLGDGQILMVVLERSPLAGVTVIDAFINVPAGRAYRRQRLLPTDLDLVAV